MRTTIGLAVLVLGLASCSNETPAEGDGETVGDGDDDVDVTGDGDGDGDGDGPMCLCENTGNYDECQASETPLEVYSLLDTSAVGLEFDEVCAVEGLFEGTMTLDCPSGAMSLTLALTPVWTPEVTIGEALRLRSEASPDMADGEVEQFLRWRLDRADDDTLLASYTSGAAPLFIDDPFTTEIATDKCPRVCDAYLVEPVGLWMTSEAAELLLFTGQIGDLGEHQVHVGVAERYLCGDVAAGSYTVAIVAEPEPAPDACDLVLDQTYSSQEQLECGLGPNGVVLCNWTISFDAGQYVWNYSDVGEVDDYACAGLELLSVPQGDPIGSVSADGATLTWDGVLYDRE